MKNKKAIILLLGLLTIFIKRRSNNINYIVTFGIFVLYNYVSRTDIKFSVNVTLYKHV